MYGSDTPPTHTHLSDPFPLLPCLKESLDHFHYFHIDRLGVTDLPRTFAQVCGGRRPIIRPDFPRQDLHFRTFALNQISPPLFFFFLFIRRVLPPSPFL